MAMKTPFWASGKKGLAGRLGEGVQNGRALDRERLLRVELSPEAGNRLVLLPAVPQAPQLLHELLIRCAIHSGGNVIVGILCRDAEIGNVSIESIDLGNDVTVRCACVKPTPAFGAQRHSFSDSDYIPDLFAAVPTLPQIPVSLALRQHGRRGNRITLSPKMPREKTDHRGHGHGGQQQNVR